MDKIAPYQSIRLVAKAGMLGCPIKNGLPCGLCEYGSFCHALVEAFTEARKIGESNPTIGAIINQEYENRIAKKLKGGDDNA